MSWLFSLCIIAILVTFNLFSADAIVRLRREVNEIHRAVVRGDDTDDEDQGRGASSASKGVVRKKAGSGGKDDTGFSRAAEWGSKAARVASVAAAAAADELAPPTQTVPTSPAAPGASPSASAAPPQ